MAEPSLEEVFGLGTAQTLTTLTIPKTSLEVRGLIASGTNTAESLLAAILAHARQTLTSENQLVNVDQSVTIGDFTNETTFTRNNVKLRRATLPISFQRADTGGYINPMDY